MADINTIPAKVGEIVRCAVTVGSVSGSQPYWYHGPNNSGSISGDFEVSPTLVINRIRFYTDGRIRFFRDSASELNGDYTAFLANNTDLVGYVGFTTNAGVDTVYEMPLQSNATWNLEGLLTSQQTNLININTSVGEVINLVLSTNVDAPDVAVTFDSATYDVNEGEEIDITVNASTDPLRDITIPLTYTGLMSTQFTGPTEVTIPAGSTSATISITPIVGTGGDTLTVGFGTTLPNNVTATGTTAITINTVILTVDVVVNFTSATYSVNEGSSVTVSVNLDTDPLRTVTIPLNTTGTASPNDIVGTLPTEVTFNAGETVKTFVINAATDSLIENDETVIFNFGTLPANVTVGTTATTTLTINNITTLVDVEINFASATYSIDEGETLNVTINADVDPERDITIPLVYTVLNSNLFAAPSEVTIADGSTSISFNIVFEDDTGGDSLVINFGTLPTSVTAGTVSSTTITIDNVLVIPVVPISSVDIPHYECLAVSFEPQMSGPPTVNIIDRLQELQNIGWSDELVGDGLGSISLNSFSIPSAIATRFLDLANNPTELWIYRDGVLVHSGPIIGLQLQGTTITVVSRGRLYYLNTMIIQDDYKHDDRDQYTIVKDLIDQWQNDDYGHFGINTGNIGTSGTLRNIEYAAHELRNVRDEVELLAQNVEGFDFYLDQTTGTLGTDFQQDLVLTDDRGTDKTDTVFLETRGISNALIWSSVGREDVATWARVLGTSEFESHVVTRTNNALMQKFGKRGITLTVDGAQTASTVGDYADQLINLMGDFQIEVGGQNQNATAFPFPEAKVDDFIAGDDISFIFETGFGLINVSTLR